MFNQFQKKIQPFILKKIKNLLIYRYNFQFIAGLGLLAMASIHYLPWIFSVISSTSFIIYAIVSEEKLSQKNKAYKMTQLNQLSNYDFLIGRIKKISSSYQQQDNQSILPIKQINAAKLIKQYIMTCIVCDYMDLDIHHHKKLLENEISAFQQEEKWLFSGLNNVIDEFQYKDVFNLAILSNNSYLFHLLKESYQPAFNLDSLDDAITHMSQFKTVQINNAEIIDNLPLEIKNQFASIIKEDIVCSPNLMDENNISIISHQERESEGTKLAKLAVEPEKEKIVFITPELEDFFNNKDKMIDKIDALSNIVSAYPHYFIPYQEAIEKTIKELKFFVKIITVEYFHEALFISTEVNNLIKNTLPNLFGSFVKIMKIDDGGRHTIDFENNLTLVNRYLADCHDFAISMLQQDFKQNSHILSSKFGEFNMEDLVKENNHVLEQKMEQAVLYAKQ